MRILFLNTFPVWGGDENWTVNLAKGLQVKGHHVVISCPPDSETLRRSEANGIETFALHIGPDIAFCKIPSFVKYLRKNKIEVLLCVQNRDMKIGALAGRIAGVPAIFGRQGLVTIRRKIDHKYVFTNFLDGIITNTKSIKEYYKEFGWFSDDFIKVVYDGLTPPSHISQIDLHKEFGLNNTSKVIISTGRLVEQKRFDLLIEVAAMIKQENLDWQIIVVGKGRLEMKLKDKVRQFQVEDIIKFVGFREDVLSLVNFADIFVLSSDFEGMSNSLKEAMAIGTACVATDVFGVDELFQNGKSGFMVKKGDPKAIFKGIKTLIDNPELKNNIEKNGAKFIQQAFTMRQMIDHVESIFEEQLAKRKHEHS